MTAETPRTPKNYVASLLDEIDGLKLSLAAKTAELADMTERMEANRECALAKTAECDRLREDAERYAARQNEEYMNLLRSLKVGETTSREAHALSYNAHSDAARREGGNVPTARESAPSNT